MIASSKIVRIMIRNTMAQLDLESDIRDLISFVLGKRKEGEIEREGMH
jgi:hypothetical protein